MTVSLEDVKKLREMTGASMMACKKALEENAGNFDSSLDYLRKRGEAKAAEKSDRTTGQGVVHSYVHSNKRVGAMIHLACETDFVAKNEIFIELANDLAMQIVASRPITINPTDIDEALVEREKSIWKDQLKNEGKPDDKIEMIMAGKEKKFRDEMSLMEQAYIKDPEKRISQLLKEYINKLGENIKVEKFIRYEI